MSFFSTLSAQFNRRYKYILGITGGMILLYNNIVGLGAVFDSIETFFWGNYELCIILGALFSASAFLPLKPASKQGKKIGFHKDQPDNSRQNMIFWLRLGGILIVLGISVYSYIQAADKVNEKFERLKSEEKILERKQAPLPDAKPAYGNQVGEKTPFPKQPKVLKTSLEETTLSDPKDKNTIDARVLNPTESRNWVDARNPAKVKAEVRWALVENFSSLKDSLASDQSLHLYPDPTFLERMRKFRGFPKDEPNHAKIIAMLRARAIETGHKAWLRELSDKKNLFVLTLAHFNKMARLRYAFDAWKRLKVKDAEIADTYLLWVRKYMGQWSPKLSLTIDNTMGEKSLEIIAVIYEVKKFVQEGSFMGSSQDYDFGFSLFPEAKKFEWQLAKQSTEVSVPAGQSEKGFFITLCPQLATYNLGTWEGELSLKTNQGILPVGRLVLTTYNNFAGYIKD